MRQMIAVAEQIALLINGFAPNGVVSDIQSLEQALYRYADIIRPWASTVSEQMIAELNQRDEQAWIEMGKEIGRGLRAEVTHVCMRPTIRELRDEQIRLITSLPVEAAQRVHELALDAMSNGTRAESLYASIMATGDVTMSRAKTIARTEISRTGAMLTITRAESVGSTQYIWHTSGDSDVRERHVHLNGKVFFYNDPPVAGERGEKANPGCIYNCRCFMEPILPD